MAVAKVKSRCTYREDTDEKRNGYARTATAIFIIMHMKRTEGTEKGKVFVGLAEPFHG